MTWKQEVMLENLLPSQFFKCEFHIDENPSKAITSTVVMR